MIRVKFLTLTFVGALAANCFIAETGFTNEATEIFECAELAQWAHRDQDTYRFAILGYEEALKSVSEGIELSKQAAQDKPSFTAERSPEFWAGMWYGAASQTVRDWLQARHPLQARQGAGVSERVTAAVRQAVAWKPIADLEFRQRGCELYLLTSSNR